MDGTFPQMAGAVCDCGILLACADGSAFMLRSGASHRRKLAGSTGRTVEGSIYTSAGVFSVAMGRSPLLCRTDALGYWLIALTALCLGHFCSRFLAVKLLLALYLFAALWIKLPVMSQPPFVFLTGWNHWVFLLHNLAEPWRLPLTAVTTAIVTMGMVWLVTRRWYWRFSVSIRGKRDWGPITDVSCLPERTDCFWLA